MTRGIATLASSTGPAPHPATIQPGQTHPPRQDDQSRLTPSSTLLLALGIGLLGGYLDLVLMLTRKLFFREDLTLRVGRDFAWSVPVSHAFLLLTLGILVATALWLRPRMLSRRSACWLFATLAIWSALLRLPIYGICGLLLAAGLARPISAAAAARLFRPRPARIAIAANLGLLVTLAALSSGRQYLDERRTTAQLPPAKAGAPNVLLIVWDTVRAYNLSTYGYARNTTPNLTELARHGVLYKRAISAAPWTYPSHSSFFTGHWPLELNSQWKFFLDTPYPTLAQYLAGHGYQTAGFAANTFCCNHETGLARGFTHFEDFSLSPRSIVGRSATGKWILTHILYRGMYHDMKWIALQSKGAWGTGQSFLDWLQVRRTDRPFFAFLNWYDAHDPYIPPPAFEGRFGIRASSIRDRNFLFDYMGIDHDHMEKRDIQLAVDNYDNCIAFLDSALGRLILELKSQGLLDNTLVVITADHGEAFGDHLKYGHTNGLYLDEIGVPLLIIPPAGVAGQAVDNPVSLRDLPATIVDQLGLSAGSPFPGQSLAQYWAPKPAPTPAMSTSPAFSELATGFAFGLAPTRGESMSGYQMSLVAFGHHYLQDGTGNEALYDLTSDPYELRSILTPANRDQTAHRFRKRLLEILTASPGTTEVETAYLHDFKNRLATLVSSTPPPADPSTH